MGLHVDCRDIGYLSNKTNSRFKGFMVCEICNFLDWRHMLEGLSTNGMQGGNCIGRRRLGLNFATRQPNSRFPMGETINVTINQCQLNKDIGHLSFSRSLSRLQI